MKWFKIWLGLSIVAIVYYCIGKLRDRAEQRAFDERQKENRDEHRSNS